MFLVHRGNAIVAPCPTYSRVFLGHTLVLFMEGSQVGQRLPSLPPTLDPSPPPLIPTPAHLVYWAKGCLPMVLLFLLLLLLVVLLLVGGSQLGQKLPHNAPILTPYSTPTLPSTPSPTSGSSSSSSLFSTYSWEKKYKKEYRNREIVDNIITSMSLTTMWYTVYYLEIHIKLVAGSTPCLTTQWWQKWTSATLWATEPRLHLQQARDMLPTLHPTPTQVNLFILKIYLTIGLSCWTTTAEEKVKQFKPK